MDNKQNNHCDDVILAAAIAQRREEATKRTILRIAELRVKYLGLNDTPTEYIRKCQENHTKRLEDK